MIGMRIKDAENRQARDSEQEGLESELEGCVRAVCRYDCVEEVRQKSNQLE